MKLLIVTQKVDENDDVLGFFHRWIEEFAKHCEHITVICLYKGEYHLPENVKVLSLGKEEGGSRAIKTLRYIVRFYRYLWSERKNYDSVFVHMNQIYILLGWKIWRLLSKKILFWYNHKVGTLSTRMAIMFSHNVFYTSPSAFTAKYKKSKQMPAGIDTEKFTIDDSIERKKGHVLSLGRIDPVKNIHVLLQGIKLMDSGLVVNIYGSGEGKYYDQIKRDGEAINTKGNNLILFHGSVSNNKTPEVYNQHEVFVNLTNSGSLDKTILEAMACGVLPVVSNKSFAGVLPGQLMFKENDPKDLAEKIKNVIALSDKEKKDMSVKLRDIVVKYHDLRILVRDILNINNT